MPSIHRLPRPRRALSVAACGFVLTLFAACSSSGSGADKVGRSTVTSGSVTYSNPARNSVFSLVSESMLIDLGIEGDTPAERTLNFNSQKRSSASVKVCRDDVIAGLEQAFDLEDFGKFAIEGAANLDDRSTDGLIEVQVNGATRYMTNPDDPEILPEHKETFANLIKIFIEVYSQVPQYQAVNGAVEFKKPEVSSRARSEMQNGAGLQTGNR